MKTKSKFIGLLATTVFAAIIGTTNLRAAETKTAPERVGVYDSRVIAYAHFWTEAHQKKINDLARTAREAKATGQTNRYHELAAQLNRRQEQNHLQVFSTAPVDNVLAEMKDRVAAVQKEAGVSRLVSKWDDKTLTAYPRDRQVDVTDLLLREFKLSEKQMKVVEDLRKQKPLPLDQAEKLMREGKL